MTHKSSQNKVSEGISGVYPDLPLWKEFTSAAVHGVLLVLPVIFAKLKQSLSQTDLVKYATKVLRAVKRDNTNTPLRDKIARAVQETFMNPNVDASAHVNYQQDVLNLLPRDLEKKEKDQIESHFRTSREKLGLPPVKSIKF